MRPAAPHNEQDEDGSEFDESELPELEVGVAVGASRNGAAHEGDVQWRGEDEELVLPGYLRGLLRRAIGTDADTIEEGETVAWNGGVMMMWAGGELTPHYHLSTW